MSEDRHMTYVAIPYSHPDPDVRENRFRIANRVAAKLMADGLLVFSPISHSHPIALELERDGDSPKDFEYWKDTCRRNVGMCDSVTVVTAFGWEHSVGLRNEVQLACETGKEVRFVNVFGCTEATLARHCEVCGYETGHVRGVCTECLMRK